MKIFRIPGLPDFYLRKHIERRDFLAVYIKPCTIYDVNVLQSISYDTFMETFAEDNTAEDIKAYTDKAFDKARLQTELHNPQSYFAFIYQDAKLAGYIKMNRDEAQTEARGEDGLELQRIYVKKAYLRQGHGERLLQYAVQQAEKLRKSFIWLGVWEHNDKAIRFYKKWGFTQTGAHAFYVGNDEQKDLIMEKELGR